jgi:ribonuclease Z
MRPQRWGVRSRDRRAGSTTTARPRCRNFREAMRWHSESFGFQNTSYTTYPSPEQIRADWSLPVTPRQVSDDPWGDGFSIVPVELDWRTEGGVAYWNSATGVKITHFPVIHCRKGSIGYKLEWKGLSMMYTSDTKPEKVCVRQASGGKPIDVFIHEMIVPPEIWAMQAAHMPAPDYSNPTYVATVERIRRAGQFAHAAGGLRLPADLIDPQPRLVATHFPSQTTVHCAMNSVGKVRPTSAVREKLTFSFDRMLISVNHRTGAIRQRRAATLDFGSSPLVWIDPTKKLAPPKYADPYMQLERLDEYKPSDGYCDTGY